MTLRRHRRLRKGRRPGRKIPSPGRNSGRQRRERKTPPAPLLPGRHRPCPRRRPATNHRTLTGHVFSTGCVRHPPNSPFTCSSNRDGYHGGGVSGDCRLQLWRRALGLDRLSRFCGRRRAVSDSLDQKLSNKKLQRNRTGKFGDVDRAISGGGCG